MRLSKNFELAEFTRSQAAVEHGIDKQFLPLPSNILNNLNDLIKVILQPLRSRFGSRIFVTSSYRCKELNTALRGSINSDHMEGKAADVTCKNPDALYKLAIEMDLPYKQLIYYVNRNFIHISFDPNDKRKWHARNFNIYHIGCNVCNCLDTGE